MSKSVKKTIVITAAVLIGLMLFASVYLILKNRSIAKDYYHELAAERWDGTDVSCSEVSVYYEENVGIATPDVAYAVTSINQRLKSDNYLTVGDNGLNWYYAYAGIADITVEKGSRSIQAEAFGIGGEFFKIHEMPLLSGTYFDTDIAEKSMVILDEYAAWELFGAVDVAGMQVLIGNDFYTVAGVVGTADTKASMAAYGDRCKIYLPYEALRKNVPELTATCFQVVLPNPVESYARSVISGAFGIRDLSARELAEQKSPLNFENRIMVENTGRFGFLRLREKLKYGKYSSMRTDGIKLPFWENMARYEEERQLKRYRLAIALLVQPVLSVFTCVILIIKAILLRIRNHP